MRRVDQTRIHREVAATGCGQWCGATVVEHARGVIIRRVAGGVKMDDAVVQRSIIHTTAPTRGVTRPVSGQGAVLERDGLVNVITAGPSAVIDGPITAQRAIVQGAPVSTAAAVTGRIAAERAVVE